jgi:hypothetical protein
MSDMVDEPSAWKERTQPAPGKSARPSLESFIKSTAGRVSEVEVDTLSQEISAAYSAILAALSAHPTTSPLFLRFKRLASRLQLIPLARCL